jgi:hypothetical protein
MNTGKVFQTFCQSEVLETTTITAGADTGGSLNSKGLKFYGKSKDGVERGYWAWLDINSAGVDPVLGKKEIDAITFRADVGGNYGSTYFTINNGPAATEVPYYVYFTVAGVGYDPKLGKQEVSRAVCVADSARSLSGKYFTIRDGADASYYVWYSVSGGANTDPAPGGTGIKISLIANDINSVVARKTKEQLHGYVDKWTIAWNNATQLDFTNVAYGACTDAGAGTSGFTVTTPTAGIAATGALATKTKLCVVNVASGDTDHAVAGKFVTAINAVWTGAAVARAPTNDHIVDVTHPEFGNCTNTADGNVGGTWSVAVGTAGVDPTTGTTAGKFTSIKVSAATGASANTIATAFRAAVNAVTYDPANRPSDFSIEASGATSAIILTNRWGGQTVTATADIDTSWSIVRTLTGATTLQPNAGQNVSSADYVIKPDVDEVIYLNSFILSLSDTAVTTGTSFGALAGLTTGVLIEIVDKSMAAPTTVVQLVAPVKTNAQFLATGYGTSLGSTYLQSVIRLSESMGAPATNAEIPVDGKSGQYVRLKIVENMNGLDGLYSYAQGHYF